MSTDYATKINALLDKAASTTHEAERDAFTEKAERLMMKWGLSDAALDAARARGGRPAVSIEKRTYDVSPARNGSLLAEAATRMAGAVGPVKALYYRGTSRWLAVGYADDLARVELYIPPLLQQVATAWRAFCKGSIFWSESERRTSRLGFFTAFAETVAHRLQRMFAAEVDEAEPGTGLAIINRAEKVADRLAELYPNVKPRRARAMDEWAMYAGRSAGQRANIHAGQVDR